MRRRTAAVAAILAAFTLTADASAATRAHAPSRTRAFIADLVAATPAYPRPRAHGRARWLQPLGAWTGGPVGLLILRAKPGWVRVRLPDRPNNSSAWIQSDRIRVTRTRWRVKIDVSARRVSALRSGRVKRRFEAVVGAPATPTPTGRLAVYEIAWQDDPGGFLGPVALHLTAHSDVLDNYGGGPGRVALHGRGGASLNVPLGSAASHGCIRVDSHHAAWLARKLRPGAPVTVVP